MYREYFQIISGERCGVFAAFCRSVLFLLSLGYSAVIRVRNLAYEAGILRTHRVSVPVVSLGNLTTGGTGKTPVAAFLAKELIQAGLKPAVISRGYRSDSSGKNDETRVLEFLVPGCLTIQNPDRLRGAKAAIGLGAEVVVLDDGFQHRRLERDFNLLLIDALNPHGYDHLLPRGLLREPRSGVGRADLVLITRADLISREELSAIKSGLAGRRSKVRIVEVGFSGTQLVTHSGVRTELSILTGKPLFSFCGIGNPEGFWRTLATATGAKQEGGGLGFPDHHHYTETDLKEIVRLARASGSELLVTTLKDLVKIGRDELDGLKLYALETELRLLSGESDWRNLIESLVQISRTESSNRNRSC